MSVTGAPAVDVAEFVGSAKSSDGVFISQVEIVGQQIAMTLCVRKLPLSSMETEFYGAFRLDAETCGKLADALATAAQKLGSGRG